MQAIVYSAFLFSGLITYMLSGTNAFCGCGSITLFLGFVSALTLSNQIHQYQRNEEAWHLKSSPREVNPGSSWVEPVQSTSSVIFDSPAGGRGSLVAIEVQDTVPDWLKTPWMRDEWRKQDMHGALATWCADNNGIVTDEFVRRSIADIERLPFDQQDDALDTLDVMTLNGHPHMLAADVRDEIRNARDEWYEQFKRGGG